MTIRDLPARRDQRGTFEAATRLALLEDDIDRADAKFVEMQRSVSRLTNAAYWVAGMFATATVSLVLNFLFGKIVTGG